MSARGTLDEISRLVIRHGVRANVCFYFSRIFRLSHHIMASQFGAYFLISFESSEICTYLGSSITAARFGYASVVLTVTGRYIIVF